MAKVGDETIRNVNLLEMSDPFVGQIIEQYRIETLIGTGAMGIVYRGVHQVIGKAAAIKILKLDFADDPEMVQRLIREARTVNAIRHPAIVDIFGFGTLPKSEQPYIVMDLLEGDPLDAYIKQHAPMRPRQVAAMLDELLSALSAAHAVGVIHRDLKPGNVFVESKPDGKLGIKVIDFGLAKQADRAGGSVKPTNPGTLLGTPAFMAPEQVLGTKVTPVTDLYAVGGIAYQMLTTHLPHEGTTAIEVLSAKMSKDPVRPRQWQSDIPVELEAWVMNLMEREPEKRMQSADEARKALRKVMDANKVGSSTPVPKRNQTGLVPRKNWGEAKTLQTEEQTLDGLTNNAGKSSETSTNDHPSPFAPEGEPTAPPMRSPFQSKSPSRQRLPVVADADVTPQPQPVEPSPAVAPSAPAQVQEKSRTGLWVGLAVALAALIGGLVFLISRS